MSTPIGARFCIKGGLAARKVVCLQIRSMGKPSLPRTVCVLRRQGLSRAFVFIRSSGPFREGAAIRQSRVAEVEGL